MSRPLAGRQSGFRPGGGAAFTRGVSSSLFSVRRTNNGITPSRQRLPRSRKSGHASLASSSMKNPWKRGLRWPGRRPRGPTSMMGLVAAMPDAYVLQWHLVVVLGAGCDVGYFADDETRACSKCIEPFYSPGGTTSVGCDLCVSIFYRDGATRVKCPEGLNCFAGSKLESDMLEPGYWRAKGTSVEMERCLRVGSCDGRNATGLYSRVATRVPCARCVRLDTLPRPNMSAFLAMWAARAQLSSLSVFSSCFFSLRLFRLW